VKLVHLVGFIIKKFVTMHGHMNVKKKKESYLRGDKPCLVSFVSCILVFCSYNSTPFRIVFKAAVFIT